ncbi:MAG: hypothetical protein IKE70_01705 [Bacilli bacterium]|nr:hypothetical protein [Bacilli bacterium]
MEKEEVENLESESSTRKEKADSFQSNPQYSNQPMYYPPQNNGYNIPEEYRPITMWGYFGYQLLFAIPCVGFIILCVFAFGGTRNINLRNYSRSYFCYIILFSIFLAIIIILAMVFGVSSTNIRIN